MLSVLAVFVLGERDRAAPSTRLVTLSKITNLLIDWSLESDWIELMYIN
jgi:hypothetical protein